MELKFPKLKNSKLTLRPLNPDDYKLLFGWQSHTENLHLWWADRRIMSYDDFVDDFQRRLRGFFHQIFMIDCMENDKRVTVGMIYDYQYNAVDRYTYLCIYLVPEYTAKGLGFQAGYLFCEYLFLTFNLRKIYSDVYGFNEPSLKINRRNMFREEGVLRGHRWFNDRYWDLHILALTREDFEKLTAPGT